MELGRSGRKQARGRFALLVAVFALLAQALVPAAALAAQATGVTYVELCTSQGAQTIALDKTGQPKSGFAGLPCQDCLAAATAVVVTPELTIVPTAYVVAVVRHATAADTPAPRARAPPRPPGQGPPLLHA